MEQLLQNISQTMILKCLKKHVLKVPLLTYYSTDRVLTDDPTAAECYPLEFLPSMMPSGMPPHSLNVKAGAIIMLLRNIFVENCQCNDIRLEVIAMYEHCLEASLIVSPLAGRQVLNFLSLDYKCHQATKTFPLSWREPSVL